MEERFEPAKEEAVRIFLEGGVPTSCWELRNRHLKTLWDQVSGVHEVHMGNKWTTTGLFLVNGLLGPILWSVHFDKALTGKDANWSIPVPAVWLQQQDGWASMRRGTWAISFSKLPYFREMQVGEISITWPNRLFCSNGPLYFSLTRTPYGLALCCGCTAPIPFMTQPKCALLHDKKMYQYDQLHKEKTFSQSIQKGPKNKNTTPSARKWFVQNHQTDGFNESRCHQARWIFGGDFFWKLVLSPDVTDEFWNMNDVF